MALKYTPDSDIKVHGEGAIRLICATYQSHEAGLPEWVKNSSDEYARRESPPEERVIVIILVQGGRGRSKGIAVLDFGGMRPETIDNNFRHWADPNAATRNAPAAQVQGGHGNGGKCYMTMMFSEHSVLRTARGGQGSRYGVAADSFQFGYIPDADTGRGYPVADRQDELRDALNEVGLKLEDLPSKARTAFERAEGFTLVLGRGPRGYKGRIPSRELITAVKDHPQTTRAIEFCDVFFMDGKRIEGPLVPTELSAAPEFVEPRVIPIPAELIDPVSNEIVSVKVGEETGALTLKTSNVRMTHSRKNRHIVTYHAGSDFVGYIPVTDFDIRSAYSAKLYGDCQAPVLAQYKTNERGRLAESPTTRAVEAWLAEQFDDLCKEWEALDRRARGRQERNELSRMNDALDAWKNQFMSKMLPSIWGTEGGGRGNPDSIPLPAGHPTRVEVSLRRTRAGVGVPLRPTLRFFEDAKRVRAVPYAWQIEDTNVAWIDPEINVVITNAPGTTRFWAQTEDGQLRSSPIDLEVVAIRGIEIQPSRLELPTASRSSLSALCELQDGSQADDISLIWTESDPAIARVSATGLVYGANPGQTEVTAGDDRCSSTTPCLVSIGPAREGDGGLGGQGFPRILVSGADRDPETGEEVTFSPDDPPVHQRVADADRNIWWINSSAPFAELYLNQANGYGYHSQAWRMYHVERVVEIMGQIALTSDPSPEPLDENEWIARWAEKVVEIHTEAAQALASFIADGTLPETA